jgi:hypothetical protein
VTALVALVVVVVAGGGWLAGAYTHVSTPRAAVPGRVLKPIEHVDLLTIVDLDEMDPSIGNMLVWGTTPSTIRTTRVTPGR